MLQLYVNVLPKMLLNQIKDSSKYNWSKMMCIQTNEEKISFGSSMHLCRPYQNRFDYKYEQTSYLSKSIIIKNMRPRSSSYYSHHKYTTQKTIDRTISY